MQGQDHIFLRRLFLGSIYDVSYKLHYAASDTGVTSIVSLGATKTGATFALTGSRLKTANFVYPASGVITSLPGNSDTFRMFQISTKQLSAIKTVVLQYRDGTPIVLTLPTAAHVSDDSADESPKITILESDDKGVRYLLTGSKGSRLNEAQFVLPEALTPSSAADTYLLFSLTKQQVSDLKMVVLQPPAPKAGKAAKPGETPSLPAVVAISLPSQKEAKATTASLSPDKKGVAKGSTSPYEITGGQLQQVTEIRYLNTPIPFSYAAAGTSITIPQLPATLVANPGVVPLEIRLADGTKQTYAVVVNP